MPDESTTMLLGELRDLVRGSAERQTEVLTLLRAVVEQQRTALENQRAAVRMQRRTTLWLLPFLLLMVVSAFWPYLWVMIVRWTGW